MFQSLRISLALFLLIVPFGLRAQFENPSASLVEIPIWDANELAGDAFSGRIYRILRFSEIPSLESREALSAGGLRFIAYLPQKLFVVSAPATYNWLQLEVYNVLNISLIPAASRIRSDLYEGSIPEWAWDGEDVRLIFQAFPDTDPADVRQALLESGILILDENPGSRIFTVRVPVSRIWDLSALPFAFFIEPIDPPAQPEDTRGRSLHRSNAIATDYPGGRHYDGSGVAVAMGDDGIIGPHIDYQGRTNQSYVTADNGDHGDMVAGILMGAGNRDPVVKGMAYGATLHVLNVWDAVNNLPILFSNSGVLITSTSYSNGCNAGYTTFAQSADLQVRLNPKLIHVFSAGNAGGSDCGYGAGAGWGNVTGGVKIGKNVIAVANLDPAGNLAASSSRGPAHDGRIKPDISSNGNGQQSTYDPDTYGGGSGTSAAAPGISGILAQLHQAYREFHNGQTAESALLKACLLNSAEDYGNPGPDFSFGWGRVNALRAVKTIEENRHFGGNILQGGTLSQPITIPPGVKEARFMILWTDKEAAPMAATALVNDLDLRLIDPGSNVHFPWVLDPTPNAITLAAPATKGNDNLNNMEQVSLQNPAPGTYTLSVSGTSVPFGPQKFFLVYEFIRDEILVTYPIGGEGFVPGETERIHWDAFGASGGFNLSYTTNNGTSWLPIATGLPGSSRLYDWTVPNTLSGQAKVRIQRGTLSAESDTSFSIIGVPANLQVLQVCQNQILIHWDTVAGATGYDVFMLGAKYMDSTGTTASNYFAFSGLNPSGSYWFSVRARGPNGSVGRRAFAINHAGGLLNCFQGNDLAMVSILAPGAYSLQTCHTDQSIVTVEIQNTGSVPQTNIPLHYRIGNGAVVSDLYPGTLPPGYSDTYDFAVPISGLLPGSFSLQCWVGLATDQVPANDTALANLLVSGSQTVTMPWHEDFENNTACSTAADCELISCALNGGWLNEPNTENDDIDWRVDAGGTPSANTGPPIDHDPGNLTGKYLYLEASNGCTGKTAKLVSPCLDLSGLILPRLEFWYHMEGGSMGDLHLDVFDGSQWIEDIIPAFSGSQGSGWNKAVVDLDDFAGQLINLSWRGTTGSSWESDMAIDDISIYEGAVPPIADFEADFTTICPGLPVHFSNLTQNPGQTWNWAISPATYTFLNGTGPADPDPVVSFSAFGTYTVSLTSTSLYGTDSETKTAYITVNEGFALPLAEDFQGPGFLPATWQLENPDGGISWIESQTTGSSGQPTAAASIDNFSYNNPGAEDLILVHPLDLTTASQPSLVFDVAYARYSTTLWDGLRIDLSTNCGVTFDTTLYFKESSALATATDQTAIWQPDTTTDWRQDSVDLSAFVGNTVQLRFVNINGYGNRLFLDNINIADPGTVAPVAAFNASSVNICQGDTIVFSNVSTGNNLSGIQWNFGSGANPSNSGLSGPHAVVYQSPGNKTVSLTLTNSLGSDTYTQTIQVAPLPIASFTVSNPGGQLFQFFNNSQYANGFSWDFGDGTGSSFLAPTHNYLSNGTFTASLAVVNGCGTDTFTQTITVSGILPPVAGFSQSMDSVCAGDTVLFVNNSTGVGITSFDWDFGTGAIPANANTPGPHQVVFQSGGTHSIWLHIANSEGVDSISSEIWVKTKPLASIGANPVSANSFQFTGTGTGATQYHWFFGDGGHSFVQNPVHTYSSSGTFEVMLVASNECGSDTATQNVTIAPTSILPTLGDVSLDLFPNPAGDFITIQASGLVQKEAILTITDISGRIILSQSLTLSDGSFRETLSLEGFSAGTYILLLECGGRQGWRKWIKH